jgi:glycerol-3-phosphate acyltransferase PlsY
VDPSPVAAAAAVLFGYLLGSILPAYLVARARGIDIRTAGSGNPGISNLAETMGYGVAALVAPYDVLKAPLAMLAALALGLSPALAYLAGAAAFLGHRAPFYLRFRGGEGIAPLVNAALLHQGIDVHTVVLLALGAYVVGHRIRQLLSPKLEAMAASDRALLRRKWLRPLAIAFPLGVLWERISSMVMFLLGAFVTLAFFPTEIASLAVLFLIFGDLLAWCIGQTVGGPGFLDKTWAGTAACLLTCVTLVSLYSSLGLVPLPVGLLGAVCATAVEAAPIQDDNFVMPVSSAIAMALV